MRQDLAHLLVQILYQFEENNLRLVLLLGHLRFFRYLVPVPGTGQNHRLCLSRHTDFSRLDYSVLCL